MIQLKGYRKWSMGVLALSLAFIAAILGRLTAELAGVLGTVATGYFAVNGYTTGRGGESAPESTGSIPSEK